MIGALSINTSLSSINFQGIVISNYYTILIFSHLFFNSQWSNVGTKFSKNGFFDLGRFLSTNNTITEIWLTSISNIDLALNLIWLTVGDLGNKGAKVIADVLSANTTLTSMHLNDKCMSMLLCLFLKVDSHEK